MPTCRYRWVNISKDHVKPNEIKRWSIHERLRWSVISTFVMARKLRILILDVMLLQRGCYCVHVMMVASRYFRLFLHMAISGFEVGLLKHYEKNFRSSSSSLGSRGGPEIDWRYSSGTNWAGERGCPWGLLFWAEEEEAMLEYPDGEVGLVDLWCEADEYLCWVLDDGERVSKVGEEGWVGPSVSWGLLPWVRLSRLAFPARALLNHPSGTTTSPIPLILSIVLSSSSLCWLKYAAKDDGQKVA